RNPCPAGATYRSVRSRVCSDLPGFVLVDVGPNIERAHAAEHHQRLGERTALSVFAKTDVRLQYLAIHRRRYRQAVDIGLKTLHLTFRQGDLRPSDPDVFLPCAGLQQRKIRLRLPQACLRRVCGDSPTLKVFFADGATICHALDETLLDTRVSERLL